MATITFKGDKVHTSGTFPEVGTQAPDFVLVDRDLKDVSLSSYRDGKKLLNIVPSLDTPVCALSTRRFSEEMEKRKGVHFFVISADLPFAMQRFCTAEKKENVIPLSMMRSKKFADDYGVLIADGPLAGLTARAVLVLDEGNRVLHAELVSEIANEPDYEQALKPLG